MAREDTLSYTVSVNGPAGDWYWQVICDRDIIARGLAPTMTKARAVAMKAAMLGQPSEDLWRPRGDAFLIIALRRNVEGLSWPTWRPKTIGDNRLLAAMPANTLALARSADARSRRSLNIPDRVERVFELNDDADRGEHKRR